MLTQTQNVMSPFLALHFPLIVSLFLNARRLVRGRTRVSSYLEVSIEDSGVCMLEFCRLVVGFFLGFHKASERYDMHLMIVTCISIRGLHARLVFGFFLVFIELHSGITCIRIRQPFPDLLFLVSCDDCSKCG